MSGCCSDDSNKTDETPMSDCCSDDDIKKEGSGGEKTSQDLPKSFFSKFLYNVGKKDFEENNEKSKGGGCC